MRTIHVVTETDIRSFVLYVSYPRIRSMAQSGPVKCLSELRAEEVRAIKELQQEFSEDPLMRRFSIHDWLRLAWSRALDVQKAAEVVRNHRGWIRKWNMDDISTETIRDDLEAGYAVVAGRDFEGRPMLWQRMELMAPTSSPLEVGIKSTWLALDAALADLESNRTGICLIYDFSNVGFNNISFNLFDVRDGSLACGSGHPSHVSRVMFLNPPMVFKIGFNAAKPLLPASISSLVSMVTINSNNEHTWYESLCQKSQLPEYLGGDQRGDYFDWLSGRLSGSRFLYHLGEIRQKTSVDAGDWKTPPEEATS